MAESLSRFTMGIHPHDIVMMKENCPNFDVCGKTMYLGLKVCNSCFWRFENQVLDFKDDTECLLCLTCLPKYHKCPTCFVLKEADTQVNNG